MRHVRHSLVHSKKLLKDRDSRVNRHQNRGGHRNQSHYKNSGAGKDYSKKPYLVVLYTDSEEKFWYYKNGQLTPAEITLPKPDVQGCNYRFTDEGIEYSKYEDGKELYKQLFPWNGKEFVKQ